MEVCDNVWWAHTKQEDADTKKFSWWLGIPLQFLGCPYFAAAGVAVDFKGSKETNGVSVCIRRCIHWWQLCQKPNGVFKLGVDYLIFFPLIPLLRWLIFLSNFVLSLSQFHFRCLIQPSTVSLTSQSVAMEIQLSNFNDGLGRKQKIDWIGKCYQNSIKSNSLTPTSH